MSHTGWSAAPSGGKSSGWRALLAHMFMRDPLVLLLQQWATDGHELTAEEIALIEARCGISHE